MDNHKDILAIPATLAAHGVKYALISPGSRNAMLSVSVERQAGIKTFVASDERSAGFMALGLAQASGSPVCLICTSGSALQNYGPAISEAFFSQTPLVVLSADRPDEWIDQADGQTIRQKNLLADHVKKSFHLPVDTHHPDASFQFNRQLNEAMIACDTFPKGPVHINIPIREPFYPALENKNNQEVRVIKPLLDEPVYQLPDEMIVEWEKAEKKLIVVGQQRRVESDFLLPFLIRQRKNIVVAAELISNLHAEQRLTKHDQFLKKTSDEQLEAFAPDFLISIGGSSISKHLKKLLRKHPTAVHWHFPTGGNVTDTYKSVTRLLPYNSFRMLEQLPESANNREFNDWWERAEAENLMEYSEDIQDELFLAAETLKLLNEKHILHLANSLAVRYGNIIGKCGAQEVFANRGTSGIDGSTSSMIGHALHNDAHHLLLTGDTAFFYDSNAFWLNERPSNFTVVIINNHGGKIFGKIPGPSSQACYEKVFIAPHERSARHLAADFSLSYREITTTAGFLSWLSSTDPFATQIVEINL